jgi:hypothetical protein
MALTVWVNCASAHIVCCVASPNDVPTDARRIVHSRRQIRSVTLSFIELLTAGAAGTILFSRRPSSDEMSGRDVYFVCCLTSRPAEWARQEARRWRR